MRRGAGSRPTTTALRGYREASSQWTYGISGTGNETGELRRERLKQNLVGERAKLPLESARHSGAERPSESQRNDAGNGLSPTGDQVFPARRRHLATKFGEACLGLEEPDGFHPTNKRVDLFDVKWRVAAGYHTANTSTLAGMFE